MALTTVLGLIRLAKLVGIASTYFSKTVAKPKKFCFWCEKHTRHRVIVPEKFAFITCDSCHVTQPLGSLGEISVYQGGPTMVELLVIAARESNRDSQLPVRLGTFIDIAEFPPNVEHRDLTFDLLRRVFGFSDQEIENIKRHGSAELLLGPGTSQTLIDNTQDYLRKVKARYEITLITVNLRETLGALSALSSEPGNFDEATRTIWQCFEYISALVAYRAPQRAVELALLNRVDEYGKAVSAQWQRWQHPSMGKWFRKIGKSPTSMPSSTVGRYAMVLLSKTTEDELKSVIPFVVTREGGWLPLMLLLFDAFERITSN